MIVAGQTPMATTEMCGGCGNADPAKRCIGCLHDFGPRAPTVAGQGNIIDLRAATDEQLRTLLDAFIDAFPSELTEPKKVVVEAARRLTELQHRRAEEAGTPDGWVLVPREPTTMMRAAFDEGYAKSGFEWKPAYRAMLAASPSSPASGVRVSEEQQEKEAAFVAAGGAKRVDGHYSNADTGVVGTVPTEVYLSYEAQAKEIAARSETETQTAIKNSILLFVLKARMAENEQCAALIEDRGKNNVGRVHPVDAGHAAAIRSRLSALGEQP